jgi:glycosyltransferase involved in cell wall biosynthesis
VGNVNPGPEAARPRAKLAALIPAWNSGGALFKTLESICRQPVDCEIFVVDDGSVPAIELPLVLDNKPVHLIRLEPNQGITVALNAGLDRIIRSGFEFISRHDCGDIDHPDRLRQQLDFLVEHEQVVLVGSSVDFRTEDGQTRFSFKAPPTRMQVLRRMCYSAAVVHSSCMFRAREFKKVGVYSQRYEHAEDYELFFRILKHFDVRNLPDALVTASYNVKGISILNRRSSLYSRLKIQLKYFDPWTIHSYLGVLQTLLLNFVPYSVASFFKSLRPARRSH